MLRRAAIDALSLRALDSADAIYPVLQLALPDIRERLGLPLVVKPAKQGSALGISVAQEAADVPAALMSALSYDDRVLLERFVAGRELAVSVLGTAEPWALPVV